MGLTHDIPLFIKNVFAGAFWRKLRDAYDTCKLVDIQGFHRFVVHVVHREGCLNDGTVCLACRLP